jgi:hypothetical protein
VVAQSAGVTGLPGIPSGLKCPQMWTKARRLRLPFHTLDVSDNHVLHLKAMLRGLGSKQTLFLNAIRSIEH